jgi:L-fucose isomerase-like protein
MDQASQAFLDAINPQGDFTFVSAAAERPSLRLFFIESGGSEAPFIKIYQNYQAPYFLLAKGDSNSLASALEILSFLHEKNLQGEIIYGDQEQINAHMHRILNLYHSREILGQSRLGVIGKPSDWLIASSLEHEAARKKFGVQFLSIPMDELRDEIDRHQYDGTALPKEIFAKGADPKTLEGALWIYGALKRLIAKYRLNGFSLRCFDLLSLYKNTACLALALLNSEGISSGCEGDEASLLSMQIFRSMGLPSFQCNPSAMSLKDNTMILAHCTLPLCLVDQKKYTFMSHFESGLGIGIRGTLPLGEVTIFKMSNDLENYHLSRGVVLENLTKENLCRSQIRVRFDNPIESYLTNPYGNHLLVAYGDKTKEIEELLDSYL